MADQKYESYWKLTFAFTDYYGIKFRKTLKIIKEFIDSKSDIDINNYSKYYEELQEILHMQLGIKLISVRKAINQYVKMGLVNSQLMGYDYRVNDLIDNFSNKESYHLILSEILYEKASFNSNITKESKFKNIKFLIKTLEKVEELTENDIKAIIYSGNLDKDFFTREEIDCEYNLMVASEFESRKYNQISHIRNLLKECSYITYYPSSKSFKLLDDEITNIPEEITSKKRDLYKHKIYKGKLKEEAEILLGTTSCFVEERKYPKLIASHIKPFIAAKLEEEYDKDNGLLLSPNLDSLFDKGYITFTSTGIINFSQDTDNKVVDFYANAKINEKFLTTRRISYLKWHKENIFKG